MATFDFMEPIHHISSLSIRSSSSIGSVPFHTSYFKDPWTLPSPTMSYEGHSHIGMAMPLSTTEIAYQDFIDSIVDLDPVSS
jgi:hypothetical protein